MTTCGCKPVMYLDGMVIKVLRIDFCTKHASVDDLIAALARCIKNIEELHDASISRHS